MNIIKQLEAEQAAAISEKRTLPEFEPGDTVKVLVRVTEGSRTRVQAYEGVCIARSGAGLNESFTVRKISYGEGVERVFPLYSPLVEGVEVVRRGRVRRAKLYYLRNLRGKSARISENTGVRAKKLNEAERQALAEERARLEAEKVAAAQALAAEKAAEEAAEAKAAEEAAAAEAKQAEEAKPEETSAETSNDDAGEADGAAASDDAIPFVDNIVLIDGIGDKTAEALIAEGVSTLTAVAQMSDEDLAGLCEKVGAGQQWQSKEWKIQAQEMIDGKPPRSKVDQDLAKKLAKEAG